MPEKGKVLPDFSASSYLAFKYQGVEEPENISARTNKTTGRYSQHCNHLEQIQAVVEEPRIRISTYSQIDEHSDS